MRCKRDNLLLLPPMILGAIVFLIGINWGLPSRKVDPYLFGPHPVWSGSHIASLLGEPGSAGGSLVSKGADVDTNPEKLRPVQVNQTDAQRAEILARYRLYTYQPDEMITFRALGTIRQTHGDPRLYQYGGLWIYPVGALLKLASTLHLIDLRSDLSFYLDHPEAFARFYIVARLYVVAFAILGIWAVFWLARKMSGDAVVAMFASIGFVLLPVVINMAHEAKPHLPGGVLMLLAIIAAVKYVETGARRSMLLAGALCGAAFGMVLTGAVAFILLPAAVYLRWRTRVRLQAVLMDLLIACGIGIAVYCITNPFVIVHLIGDRTILESNLGNTQAMYRPAFTTDTLTNAAALIADGASPVFTIAGAVIILARRADVTRKLMLVVSLPILVQFVMLSSNKPGEYARFGLFLDIVLMISAVGGHLRPSRLRESAPVDQSGSDGASPSQSPHSLRWIIPLILCAGCCVWSIGYVWHFATDSIDRTSRMILAKRLKTTHENGAKELAVYSDPAPYCLPPVNLFEWKIMLLDPGAAPLPSTDVLIKPVDEIPKINMPMRGYERLYWTRPRLLDTPISWASKPFETIVRREFVKNDASQ